MGELHDVLLGTSDFTYRRTKERLEGLTDEEWAWEPAAWCWSVRRLGDGWQADGSPMTPAVPPITTISWRLNHVIENYGALRNWTWLGLPAPAPMPPSAASAAGELARLEVAHGRWRAAIEQADDDSLATAMGPIAREYAEHSRAAFVAHELDEVIHHSAEIGVLRDLFRARTVDAPVLDTIADAAANGAWARVVELADAGADVNGGDPSPLHLAVAGFAGEAVRALVARGADTSARDSQWDLTPSGWATYFGYDELISLLS